MTTRRRPHPRSRYTGDSMSDDGRCSHPGFDASEKWCVECVTTLRARLTAAEGLLAVAADGGMTDYTDAPNEPICGFCGYTVSDCELDVRDSDDVTPQPCKGAEARRFLAAPPGRREAPACTHRCSLVGCNEMGTLVQGTGWLCPKHAALIPAAPIPQPAPAPEVCGGCGGNGKASNCTGCGGERNSHIAECGIWRPCYACKGTGCRPATPGDGRERP